MQYLGGKSRIAKKLAAKIHEIVPDATEFWDPFCGGLSMSAALSEHGRVVATDACAPLIALYEGVRAGWVPPDHIDRETWQNARSLPDSDPMKAFAGFGVSFGGKWFGGYRKHEPGKSEHIYTKRGLLRDVPKVANFAQIDWLAVEPQKIDAVKYLDPPYRGTHGYAGAPPFDFDRFVRRVAEWSRFEHLFISEYEFPIGQIVGEWDLPLQVAKGTGAPRRERLYYVAKGSL